jgi:secondary thiamine-phosphate synthase enzyme
MKQAMRQIAIETKGKGFTDFTGRVADFLNEAQLREGLLTVFCRHTSASLLIQENADPDVRTDLAAYFERVAPEGAAYIHDVEGADDMPAHIRTALTQTHLSIPFSEGRMVLGTWQGIYLFEHRSRPHRRSIVLHAIGE